MYLIVVDTPTKRQVKLDNPRLLHREEALVQECLRQQGINLQEDCEIVFAIPEATKMTSALVAKYRDRLLGIIDEMAPDKILGFGKAAAVMLAPGYRADGTAKSFTHYRGKMSWISVGDYEYVFMCTIPPFMALKPDYYWHRDFFFDIAKFCEQPEPLKHPEYEIHVCDTLIKLQQTLKPMLRAPILSLDIETSGLKLGRDRIESIGIGAILKGGKPKAVVIPYTMLFTADGDTDEGVRRLVKNLINGKSFKGELVMHNGKFDLKFLMRWMGEPLNPPRFRDTLILNHLLDERPLNDLTRPHGLKILSRQYFDADHDRFDWDAFWSVDVFERDWEPMYKYLAADLYYTGALYSKLKKRIKAESSKLWGLYTNVLMKASVVLAHTELLGVPVDVEYFKHEKIQQKMVAEQTITELRELAVNSGFPGGEKLNPRSPKQLMELLYGHLEILPEKGALSTRADIMDILLHRHDLADVARQVIECILKYRKLQKLISTYINPLIEDNIAGRIHGQFNLAGTATGRLSSEKPNLQNMPNFRGDLIRKGFIPGKNRVWLKIDYSQIELRSAAHLSGDKAMIQAYIDGRDIHSEVAAAMFGIRPEDVTKRQRFAAKFVDFGILYGRTAIGIANGPELRDYGWSVKDAQGFIDKYLAQFPSLGAWMESQKARAIHDGELTTPTGRKRRWPLMNSQVKWRAQRQALNFPVQSLASDITLNAVVLVHEWVTKNSDAKILATVHDEIDLSVPYVELDYVVTSCLNIMETRSPVKLIVPLKADAEVGPNWAELQDWEPGFVADWIDQPF